MRIRSFQLTLFVCLTRLAFAGCPTPVMTQGTTVTGANGLGLVVADFDKDGKIDYAVPSSSGQKVVVFLGHGDGTFATGVQYAHGGTGGARLVGADFNGDGFTDLAVIVGDSGSTYVVILLNNGNGTFGAPQRITTPVSNITFGLNAVDMNDDRKMDLV